MSAKQPIDNDLQNFKVYDNKTQVDNYVQEPGDRTNHHFGLPQSDTHHIIPALFTVVRAVNGLAHLDTADDLSDVLYKVTYPQ